jgi:signal transduction histidine kinase
MTIRTRLTAWYAIILTGSLLLISGGVFREIYEQLRHDRSPGSRTHALNEAGELVFQVGLPAVILGLAGGWWLTRKALAPVAALAAAAGHVTERNLTDRLPRTGNGDELDRLAEILNAMTARLHMSFTRIREFTLHASHELKTPLTILCGQIEAALGDDPALTPAQRDLFAGQLDELHRLTRIVDNLTLLTKADAGLVPLAHGPVRLDEIVRDHFADAQMLAHASGVQVELTACEPMTVQGDPHRLRQLLLNLTDNAIKYNAPQGWVKMGLRTSGDAATFEICNAGPGIPPEALPRVFDRFFRVDTARHRDVEGCGLGLSIVQWIVAAHQGSIQIASVPHQQTTVTVQLPVAAQRTPAS